MNPFEALYTAPQFSGLVSTSPRAPVKRKRARPQSDRIRDVIKAYQVGQEFTRYSFDKFPGGSIREAVIDMLDQGYIAVKSKPVMNGRARRPGVYVRLAK